MSVLRVVYYPDPVLHERSAEVTEFDASLVAFLRDMRETMHAYEGIGLAAPQVGVLKRATVIEIPEDRSQDAPSSRGAEWRDSGYFELVNPVIVASEGSVSSEEGCLSIPEYRDTVKRSDAVVVKAHDASGAPFEIKAEGLLAICLQHEIDHLDGVLFVDRLSRLKREFFKRWLKKQAREGV